MICLFLATLAAWVLLVHYFDLDSNISASVGWIAMKFDCAIHIEFLLVLNFQLVPPSGIKSVCLFFAVWFMTKCL